MNKAKNIFFFFYLFHTAFAGSSLFSQEKSFPYLETLIVSDLTSKTDSSLHGIFFYDIPLQGKEEDLRKRLEAFLFRPIDISLVQDIKKEIISFYQKIDNSFISIHVPEQKISDGCVQVHVICPKIGKVTIEGNKWFSTKSIKKILSIHEKVPLKEKPLLTKLSKLNRNPFLDASAVLSAGEKKGESDVKIVVKDRFPLRLYTGIDNTGTEPTSIYRYFAGTNFTFHPSFLFSYQYTAALDFRKFWSHFASLTFYLPLNQELIFFGSYAKIHPEINDFRSIGRSSQASFRYTFFQSPLWKDFRYNFCFGYDYKQFNSAIFFIEIDEVTYSSLLDEKNSIISQFLLSSDIAWKTKINSFLFGAEFVFSPFKIFSNQSKANYELQRNGATPQYVYGRLHFTDLLSLPYSMFIQWKGEGQATGYPLLSSEQLGLGGYNSVRGFEEREYLADNGFYTSVEWRLPSFSIFNKRRDSFFFLLFSDYGYGSTVNTFLSENDSQSLLSIGAGARYSFLPFVTARLDYGYRLVNGPNNSPLGGRFHFSAICSY